MPGWKREPLEDYEVDELIEQAASLSDDHELIVRTLLHTGMRAAELAHMQSDWANWRRGEIRVQPAGDWTPKSQGISPVHQADDGAYESGDIPAVYRILWASHPSRGRRDLGLIDVVVAIAIPSRCEVKFRDCRVNPMLTVNLTRNFGASGSEPPGLGALVKMLSLL